MQMISGFMHFDTIALRKKNAIWKVYGYNIRSVYNIFFFFFFFFFFGVKRSDVQNIL